MKIIIDDDFRRRLPEYRVILLEAEVTARPTDADQKSEMDSIAADIAGRLKVEDINKQSPIAATRKAYKVCGKDPNRYRPSQEQLMRRIVRGLGLYNVDSLVDAGNELSLLTGCSVGCFDADKVCGEVLEVGIGRAGEPYEGIGRGVLNVEGLPIVRDAEGGIGTPTSDNERTKISASTKRLVMTVHLFDPDVDAAEVIDKAKDLLTRHASAASIIAGVVSV